MASSDVQLNWYANDVLLVVNSANDDLITRLVFLGEGYAKVGAPVDTGFMRNAIYGIAPLKDNRAQAEAEAGGVADRPLAPGPALEAHGGAIHGAAEYTIYQEMEAGFMYGALERLRDVVDAEIVAVGKEHFE